MKQVKPFYSEGYYLAEESKNTNPSRKEFVVNVLNRLVIQQQRAEVERIEQAGNLHPETDAYQSELFNTQTRLAFLETYVTGRN